MFKKLIILLYKDLLIIFNDKAGLGYLFVMPLLLVLIMVSIQDNSFKSYSNMKFKIIIQNNDKDEVGNTIVEELKKVQYFQLSELDETSYSTIEEPVANDDFKIGIKIPDSTTFRLKKIIRESRINSSGKDHINLAGNNNIKIEIYFTPLITISTKMMILSLLRECGTRIESNMVISRIRSSVPTLSHLTIPKDPITYSDTPLKLGQSKIIPNSTQHNVPALTLFAMYFIVMSLAGNMIREREDRSIVRLLYLPFSMNLYVLSKFLIYFIVGLIQLFLILLMGIFVLPLIGYPALVIGNRFLSILLVGSICSMSAVSFGLLIGTITKTYQQATSLGAISVVILAAIGGVWVPVIAMPKFMQKISIISPLNWGVESFQKILVVDMPISRCSNELIFMGIFLLINLALSIIYFQKNNE
jgi:ABC-2 type transport system permease protein